MAVYQIYKILFNRSRQTNLLSTMDGRSAYDKAQELLEQMLSGKLPAEKVKRDKTVVQLDNYVERKRDGVTVLVLCDEQTYHYKEKMKEDEFVYHPGCRVIIDNRPGVAQIAIERSSSFNNNPDTVRDILQVALNKWFDQYQLTVEILAKKRQGTFWDTVHEQCDTFKDKIKRVTYEFPDESEVGPVDAPSPVLDKLAMLRSLNASLNAARGIYHAYSDKKKEIVLDRSREDIANMVAMCCNNGYSITVSFRKYGLYRFGSDIKALVNLKDDVVKEFVNGQMIIGKAEEGEYDLVHWLDEIREITEKYTDESPTQSKRKRRNTQGGGEQPDLDRVAEP